MANDIGAWPVAEAKKKAVVAVGRLILNIVWQLLADPDLRFIDLGADFYDDSVGTDRRKRDHVPPRDPGVGEAGRT